LGVVNLRGDWEKVYGPLGRLLVEKQNADVVRACEKGWRFTTDKGLRVIVIGSVMLTSDAADLEKDVDLVVGFFYTHDQGAERPTLVLSTRSRTTFDCGAFCKAHGGGGHTKAAGCSFPLGVSDPNPYTFVEELLRRHEAQLPG
jgi:nanoRNase/pAp phosphatase (c-di-AMP/oligoRNAs hydrolase)